MHELRASSRFYGSVWWDFFFVFSLGHGKDNHFVVGQKLAKIFLMVRTTINFVFFKRKKTKNGEKCMVMRDIPRFFRDWYGNKMIMGFKKSRIFKKGLWWLRPFIIPQSFLFSVRCHGKIVNVFVMVLKKQTFFFKNMVVYGMEGDLGIFQTPPSRTIALTMDFYGDFSSGSPRNKMEKYDHEFSALGSEWWQCYHMN